ncbi:unannotated protein [freshwater metagenome]|uniref:Unannotated protein n=1 Tax=freshwater metagenome TaxID=449393 RepID=A0A6J6LJX3_9ZZZZ
MGFIGLVFIGLVFMRVVFLRFVFMRVVLLGVRFARARTADQREGKTALTIGAAAGVFPGMVVAVLLLRGVEAIRIRREVIFLER